jgi:hypothetical protein
VRAVCTSVLVTAWGQPAERRADGVLVAHAFELRCTGGPNNVAVAWRRAGRSHAFYLQTLTSVFCGDNPAFAPTTSATGFDTYAGSGSGRYNGDGLAGATATWTFTDAGRPGTNDSVKLISKNAAGSTVLSVAGNLARGDHEALAQ